jgi:hypothetical protein
MRKIPKQKQFESRQSLLFTVRHKKKLYSGGQNDLEAGKECMFFPLMIINDLTANKIMRVKESYFYVVFLMLSNRSDFSLEQVTADRLGNDVFTESKYLIHT